MLLFTYSMSLIGGVKSFWPLYIAYSDTYLNIQINSFFYFDVSNQHSQPFYEPSNTCPKIKSAGYYPISDVTSFASWFDTCQNGTVISFYSRNIPMCREMLLFSMCASLAHNTLRMRQNGRQFEDDFFKCIFLNENFGILFQISLKLVPKVSIVYMPALVQVLSWYRTGHKAISEPMMHNQRHRKWNMPLKPSGSGIFRILLHFFLQKCFVYRHWFSLERTATVFLEYGITAVLGYTWVNAYRSQDSMGCISNPSPVAPFTNMV